MNRQPDKLFREKLENHQVTVPGTAWARIAQAQEKPHHGIPWLRIAAVIIPLTFLLGYFIVHKLTADGTTELAVTSQKAAPATNSSVPIVKPDVTENNIQSNPSETVAKMVERKTKVSHKTNTAKLSSTKSHAVTEPIHELLPTQPDLTPVAFKKDEHAVEPIADTPISVATIYYSIDQSVKYLDKNYREEATSVQARSSKLQKLVGFANEFKDPVGEIRQFKQDLLAFNFKNEKKDQTK